MLYLVKKNSQPKTTYMPRLNWVQSKNHAEGAPVYYVQSFLPNSLKEILKIEYHIEPLDGAHWCIELMGLKNFWVLGSLSEVERVQSIAESHLEKFSMRLKTLITS